MSLNSIPLLNFQFWFGLIAGFLIILLVRQSGRTSRIIDSLREKIQKIQQGSEINSKQHLLDPLDIYEGVKQSFQKGAEIVYNRFERQSAKKDRGNFGSSSKTLFRSVEDFTSGNLWNRMLSLVVKSSQRLQKMHHGLLRFNLIWLLIFIIGLSVFVWIWYTKGGGVI